MATSLPLRSDTSSHFGSKAKRERSSKKKLWRKDFSICCTFLYLTVLYFSIYDRHQNLTLFIACIDSLVYKDGKVCISILHPPGDDPMSGELASERWRPTQNVQSILLSVISMIADPNCSSPANVDASVEYRDRKTQFDDRVKNLADKAKKACPKRVVIPHPDTDPEERARALKKQQLMMKLDSSDPWLDEDDVYEDDTFDDDDDFEPEDDDAPLSDDEE